MIADMYSLRTHEKTTSLDWIFLNASFCFVFTTKTYIVCKLAYYSLAAKCAGNTDSSSILTGFEDRKDE